MTFGYGTGQMLGRGTILEGWREDSGVQTDSRAELEALMDAWGESVGRALDLSAARWLNPAPLRITAYPDPVVCDPAFDLRPVDDIGFVHVIVAGGAWVPTGIELDGEVVALARGSGRVVVRVDCSREPGMHDMLLNVHDLGPQTPASIVETTIEMNFLPSQRVGGGLGLRTSRTPYYDQTAFDPTAYCEPGGKAKIAWSLFNSHATGYGAIEKPTTVRIDGELAVSRADPSQISVDYGEHWVTCQQEPGLQTVVIEATDSGRPPQSARYEYLLRVVESHPSGLEWSEIRPDDYPPPPLPVPAAAAPSDAAEQCRSGTAVASPEDNPGLVSDCAALLKTGARLAGDTALDWDAGTPITRWEGVTVSGQPGRVVAIELVMRGLTGSIPPELGTLAELQDLNLSYNRLTGTIPVELGALSNLRELGLIANALTGTIPAELGALDDLQFLGLTHNQLTGTIPPELGALGDLRYLDVADNQLTGTIPVGLGGLRQLETLGLAGNQLTGTIPPELGGLHQLETLSLAANRLTGAIPVELGTLRNLHTLNLIRNQLTGTIPAELGGLGTLEFLHLSENQLTGTISVELRALRNLKTLGASDNELTGSIPAELGALHPGRARRPGQPGAAGTARQPAHGEHPGRAERPGQPGHPRSDRQRADGRDPGRAGFTEHASGALAERQPAHGGDPRRAECPEHPEEPEHERQPLDRGDPRRARYPWQPAVSGAERQPAHGGDPGRAGRTGRVAAAVSGRQRSDRVHSARAGHRRVHRSRHPRPCVLRSGDDAPLVWTCACDRASATPSLGVDVRV